MKGLGRYLEQIQLDSCQEDSMPWQEDLDDEVGSAPGETGSRDLIRDEDRGFISGMNRLKRMIGQNTLLNAYRFSQDELVLIARICHRTRQNGDQDYSAREICELTPNLKGGMEEQFRFVAGLIDREILSSPYLREHDFRYDPRAVFGTTLRLNGLLWNLILGRDPVRVALRDFARSGSDDPVEAVLKMTGILFLHFPELSDGSFADAGICYGRSVNLALDAFLNAIDPAQSWKAFRACYGLNRFWQKCLLLIHFYNRDRGTEPSPALIASLLARNGIQRKKYLDLLTRDNLLRAKELIDAPPVYGCGFPLELTRLAVNELHSKGGLSDSAPDQALRLLEHSAYLHRINPDQGLEELILDAPTRSLIVSVIERLRHPDRTGIAAWGLMGASLTRDMDVQQGCNVLLHGVPGTGKTFIAGVMANELGRDLVQINAGSIRSMFYGTTEKQARELFSEMRRLHKLVAPVFLLNEGDQLIHQRLESPTRSVDQAENTIQSVFLEELESFPGILVVTSNLASNLDPAMSRRFHFKLEIQAPDLQARIALWRLHLKPGIPGANEIPVEGLAGEFAFTGGQIRLVVQNACHEAYLRGRKARLSLADLRKYAMLERGTSFEHSRTRVGFAC